MATNGPPIRVEIRNKTDMLKNTHDLKFVLFDLGGIPPPNKYCVVWPRFSEQFRLELGLPTV